MIDLKKPSEEKLCEFCPYCGSLYFLVSRDMKGTRHCKCGVEWLPDSNYENLFKRISALEAENRNLKSIIAKEISENDEFGAEYVIASILRKENAKLREALKAVQKHGLDHYEDCPNASYSYESCDCDMAKTELLIRNALKECEGGNG